MTRCFLGRFKNEDEFLFCLLPFLLGMTQHKQKNIIYIKSPNIAWIEIASCMKEKYNFNPVLWFPNDSKNLTECKSKFPESRMIAHFQALKVIRPNWFKETSACTDANFLLKHA